MSSMQAFAKPTGYLIEASCGLQLIGIATHSTGLVSVPVTFWAVCEPSSIECARSDGKRMRQK